MNALGFAVLVFATSGPANTTVIRPAAQAPEMGAPRLEMITGCISSQRANSYQLTNVIGSAMSAVTNSGMRVVPRQVGTIGSELTQTTDPASWYALNSPFNLKDRIGEKVEIIGMVDATPPDSRSGATVKVRSVRMLNERCN